MMHASKWLYKRPCKGRHTDACIKTVDAIWPMEISEFNEFLAYKKGKDISNLYTQ